MVDKYEEILDRYKKFIEENSQYNARVVKYNTNTSAYFPLVTCVLSDNKDTDRCTLGKEEYYEAHYFTINIYTKDKKTEEGIIASDVINKEICKLTTYFFGEIMNMKKTLNEPAPNLDNSILRRIMQYQCLIGNVRGNIIRR